MAEKTRLSHDDLLFVLFSAAYTMLRPESFTEQPTIGRLAQQGFVWTTEYLIRYQHFFALGGNREPDGYIKFEPGSLLVTVEATTNPHKPNLGPQLGFYCSERYQQTIVDVDNHEIWFFAPGHILSDFSEELERCRAEAELDYDLPLVVWSVDYDRNRHIYVIERAVGEHSRAIVEARNLPLSRLEVPLPRSYPLLSTRLSTPAVVFAIGTELARVILDPGPHKAVDEIWQDFPANAVRLAHFDRCLGYLSVLVPDLLEITHEEGRKLVRVKNNPGRIKTIRNALEAIRKTPSEDRLIAEVKKARAKAKRRRKETGPLPETGRKTLDEFLE